MRSGRICSVELPLSVLFQNSNFKNKLKFNDKNKKQYIDYTIFFIIFKITPLSIPRKGWSTYCSKRKRVLCWSIYLYTVYIYYKFMLNTNNSNMSIFTRLQIPGVYSNFFFHFSLLLRIFLIILLVYKSFKKQVVHQGGFFLMWFVGMLPWEG